MSGILDLVGLFPPFGASSVTPPVVVTSALPDFTRASFDADALAAVAGDDISWTGTFHDRTGAVWPFDGTLNPLTAILWRGEDQSPITPGLAVAALDPASGTFTLTLPGLSSLALAPGAYAGLVEVAVGSGMAAGARVAIEVLGRPGSAAGPWSLTTYRMMTALYPGLARLNRTDTDLGDFAVQQNLATADFIGALIDRYDPQPGFQRRRTNAFDPVSGYEIQDVVSTPPTETALAAILVTPGRLILTPPDDTIVAKIVARLAIAYVLDRQEAGSRTANPYVQDAADMRDRAMAEMASYRAYVDLDGDGAPDVLINRNCVFLD